MYYLQLFNPKPKFTIEVAYVLYLLLTFLNIYDIIFEVDVPCE